MLQVAVAVIAELFTGQQLTHRGPFYRVDTWRLYSVPKAPLPIYVSGFVEKSARLAARIGGGFICVSPDADLVKLYPDEGGEGPIQGGLKGCRAPEAAKARTTMHRLWPTDSVPGESAQLLPLPRHFGQLAQLVTKDMIADPCGPDPDPYVTAIREYGQPGFDEVYLGQVGGRLDGAFEFFATQVLPCARMPDDRDPPGRAVTCLGFPGRVETGQDREERQRTGGAVRCGRHPRRHDLPARSDLPERRGPVHRVLSGGVSRDELISAGAAQVYRDPADLLAGLPVSLLGRSG